MYNLQRISADVADATVLMQHYGWLHCRVLSDSVLGVDFLCCQLECGCNKPADMAT